MSDDGDDPVDPKPEIEESCKPKCVKQLLQYQACVKRIEEDDTGSKHCTGQYFDYWGCIDKCSCFFGGKIKQRDLLEEVQVKAHKAATKIFAKLK